MTLEGEYCLWLVSVLVCVLGWGVCQWGCVQICGWLAGSVGHFIETLNGDEC